MRLFRRYAPAPRQLFIVRVPAPDGSLVFYETNGAALILSPSGQLFRASLGYEVSVERGMVTIDWRLMSALCASESNAGCDDKGDDRKHARSVTGSKR